MNRSFIGKMRMVFWMTLLLSVIVPSLLCAGERDYLYEEEDGSIRILAYQGAETAVDIPAEIDGKPVRSIAPGAFAAQTELIIVSLPEGLLEIGADAFFGCKSLAFVSFPNSLQIIGDSAFEACGSLRAAALPEEGLKKIGTNAFFGCKSLAFVSFPNSLQTIGESAFEECESLGAAILPEGLVEIGAKAFARCGNLSQVRLPQTLTEIPQGLFYQCANLTEITLPPDLLRIGSYAFYDCMSLQAPEFPATLEIVEGSAFSGCRTFTGLHFEENLQTIGDSAFAFCFSLEGITFDSLSLEIDGHHTFDFCPKNMVLSAVEGSGTFMNLLSFDYPLEALPLPDRTERLTTYEQLLSTAAPALREHPARRDTALAQGSGFSMALRADGTVYATGSANAAQIPEEATGWTNVISLAAGYRHAVALTTDGRVQATGNNEQGACTVDDWENVVQLVAAQHSTAALTCDGDILLAGQIATYPVIQETIAQWTDVVQLSLRDEAIAGLLSDGSVVCAGVDARYDTSVWGSVIQIALGGQHLLGVTAEGRVYAAGHNHNGNLEEVALWESIRKVAAGDTLSLGLRTDGTVIALQDIHWNTLAGTQVDAWAGVVEIDGSGSQAAALTTAGMIFSTQDDTASNHIYRTDSSALPIAAHTALPERALVPFTFPQEGITTEFAALNARYIVAGDTFAAALRNNGSITSTAGNYLHPESLPLIQLSDGTVVLKDGSVATYLSSEFTPRIARDVVAVDVGTYHMIALQAGGGARARTLDTYGRNNLEFSPDFGDIILSAELFENQCDVDDWDNLIQVAAGTAHSVGLRSDGRVVSTEIFLSEVNSGQSDTGDWTDVVYVDAGPYYTVGVRSDGTVLFTGEDDGQSVVRTWANVVQVAAGTVHVVGLRSDGTVLTTPVAGAEEIATWKNVIAVAAAREYTLALQADGTVLSAGAAGDDRLQTTTWKRLRTFLYQPRSVRQVGPELPGQYSVLETEAGEGSIVAFVTGYHGAAYLYGDGSVQLQLNSEAGNLEGYESISQWTGIVAISGDVRSLFGLKEDGTCMVAGNEEYGQGQIRDLADIAQVESRDSFSTYVRFVDGRVQAVGEMPREIAPSGVQRLILTGSQLHLLREDGTIVPVNTSPAFQGQQNLADLCSLYFLHLGVTQDGTVIIEPNEAASFDSNEKAQRTDDLMTQLAQEIQGWTGVTAITGDYDTYFREEGKPYDVQVAALCGDGRVYRFSTFPPNDGPPVRQEILNLQIEETTPVEEWTDIIEILTIEGELIGLTSTGQLLRAQ